jgi:hypothetical protein
LIVVAAKISAQIVQRWRPMLSLTALKLMLQKGFEVVKETGD